MRAEQLEPYAERWFRESGHHLVLGPHLSMSNVSTSTGGRRCMHSPRRTAPLARSTSQNSDAMDIRRFPSPSNTQPTSAQPQLSATTRLAYSTAGVLGDTFAPRRKERGARVGVRVRRASTRDRRSSFFTLGLRPLHWAARLPAEAQDDPTFP
jgi:hypothetical protein